MSLIEQAAKRLEELRRAGAEIPDAPSSEGAEAVRVDGVEHLPTPEAAIRGLAARGAMPRAGCAFAQPGAARTRRPAIRRP